MASLISIVFAVLLVGGPALARAQTTNVPEGYELVFAGSQDQSTENLRFRTAYDSSATVGIFSTATVGECADLCDRRDECAGLFYQIPSARPNNNCRLLSVADEQMPRSTVTRSLSLRRLPRDEVPTEEPPDSSGSRKSRMTINDLHWGWWIFFAILPLLVVAAILCCIKCRESDKDDYEDDDDYDDYEDNDSEYDKRFSQVEDLEAGLVMNVDRRKSGENGLAVQRPRDSQYAFFYETVARNMKEEHMVSDSDTDTSSSDLFAAGSRHNSGFNTGYAGRRHHEFDTDTYMSRVATDRRDSPPTANAHLRRTTEHFYPTDNMDEEEHLIRGPYLYLSSSDGGSLMAVDDC